MRILWLLLGALLLSVGLVGCGDEAESDSAVPAVQGPALLFFYTDN